MLDNQKRRTKMFKKIAIIALAGLTFVVSLVLFTLPQKEILPVEDEFSKTQTQKKSSKSSVEISYEKETKKFSKSLNKKTFVHIPKVIQRAIKQPDPTLSVLQRRAELEYKKRAYYEQKRAYNQKRVIDYYKKQKELAQLKAQREHRVPLEVGKDGMMTPQKRQALAYKRFQEERQRHILMAKRAKLRANKAQEIN